MQSSRWLVIDNAEAYHAHNEGLASSTLFGSDASQFSTGATLTQVDLGGGGLQRRRGLVLVLVLLLSTVAVPFNAVYFISDASAWPGVTRTTESNGIATSRTFLSKPCSAA